MNPGTVYAAASSFFLTSSSRLSLEFFLLAHLSPLSLGGELSLLAARAAAPLLPIWKSTRGACTRGMFITKSRLIERVIFTHTHLEVEEEEEEICSFRLMRDIWPSRRARARSERGFLFFFPSTRLTLLLTYRFRAIVAFDELADLRNAVW